MIRKAIFKFVILPVLGLFMAGSLVFAQSGGPYELAWTTVNGGGGAMAGGAYNLTSYIAQVEPGATQSGGAYSLNGGVIDAGKSGQLLPGGKPVYLPVLLR